MKNIHIVHPESMETFFASFWKSEEFKTLQANHPFFKEFIRKMQEAPVFFFDIVSERAKYHLTSHLRLIARRDYSNNDYMHDLYYFHELCHCAEFTPDIGSSYEDWMMKLDNNELYASLLSEVLIYFMAPSMIGKTFSPLWASKFYNDESLEKHDVDEFSLFVKKDEIGYYKKDGFDWFSFNNLHSWPKSVQLIVNERIALRNYLGDESSLTLDEQQIINYNKPREGWLLKWKPHFEKIDVLLTALKAEVISAEEYLAVLEANSDEFMRPFFPK